MENKNTIRKNIMLLFESFGRLCIMIILMKMYIYFIWFRFPMYTNIGIVSLIGVWTVLPIVEMIIDYLILLEKKKAIKIVETIKEDM